MDSASHVRSRAIARAFALVLLAFAALAPAPGAARDRDGDRDRWRHRPVPCVKLQEELAGNPVIKSVTSRLEPLGAPTYCRVDLLYGTNPEQNINILVALPLNSLDGGTGGVEGAWNGRTQGVGGGGCSGPADSTVVGPVSGGYVSSGTDLGHVGGNCEPGVNEDGTYNYQFIQDFIRNAIKAQVIFAKSLARTYYDMRPRYDYWNGCSTGGRQGYLLAQELGEELDGILANAPAMYWTRFQTEQMWGQIVMKDLVGAPIAEAKLVQATASAVAVCDAADGVVDGVIDDPRTCKFSAKANVCGMPTAPATNCLLPAEAEAIDKIWDGPRNAKGEKIWFGLDRGTTLGGFFSLNGPVPFFLGVTQFHWNEHDRTFDWQTVSIDGYPQVAQDGSRNIADITDTFGNLDAFKRHGGKLLTFVGANDQLIMPRGVINYYRQMASRYGKHDEPDFKRLQEFYRLFRAPGVGHCGGGAGPQPQGLFEALVDWVEHGKAPRQILATTATGGARPLCPYPQTAIYRGHGSTDDASNFRCGGNLEKTRVVCNDVLVKYKHEVSGPLDFAGTGVDRSECFRERHGHGRDDDDDDDRRGHGDRDD